jgi:antitoxin component of MazEF toxin-antitoxin module
MSYRTEVKLIDGELYVTIPASFVRPLKWQINTTVDIEIVGNTLQMSKV